MGFYLRQFLVFCCGWDELCWKKINLGGIGAGFLGEPEGMGLAAK
jgi:hypothetical protein